MRLRKGINLVLVPPKQEAMECYGLGDDYLEEIYNNIFGDKPRHYLDKLDFRDINEQLEIVELLQKLENNDSIVYTYIKDIYKLLENGSMNINGIMQRLSNNIIIIFIDNISFDVESFKRLTNNIFKTHKLYNNKLTEIYAVRMEVLGNGKVKMKMDSFHYNNLTEYARYVQSANFSDIFSIDKYFCEAHIETKYKSSKVTSFIQAVTTEDARSIFIDYITKYSEIPLESVKNIYINKISADNLLNRNKLKELIDDKNKFLEELLSIKDKQG